MERNPFNCYELNLEEYEGLLDYVSQARIGGLSRLLVNVEKRWGDKISLILTGSDGKHERHPQSKTEIIILSDNVVEAKIVRSEIIKILSKNPDNEHFGSIEIKEIDKEPLSYHGGRSNVVYPDRILGACCLLGNEHLFFNARIRVIGEISGKNRWNREIRKKIIEQKRTHRKTMETGIYRGKVVYDPKSGIQYYFEGPDWKENRMGLKMGPIRAAQRNMDVLIARSIINKKLKSEEVAEKFPSNTSKRFSFLSEKGIITNEEEKRYASAYLWFLREYHRIQETFKRSSRDRVIEHPFNLQEYQEHLSSIEDFLKVKI